MDIRVLQYFLAVAKEENISAAAQSLYVTQPTMSRQLKELEEELGHTLFLRGNRKITLTPEGELLRKRAEEILSLIHRTKTEIRSSMETIAGDIYIGCGETQGIREITRIMARMHEEHPKVNFHIVSSDALDACDQLDKGLLDFAILLGDFPKLKYDYLTLPIHDIWGVLMRKDSPLAQKETIVPSDIVQEPLILSRQTGNKNDLYRWLGKMPADLHTVATYNLIFNASIMVEEGLGYAFALDGLVDTTRRNLAFRPLRPALTVPMHLVWKKSHIMTRPTELFLQAVEHFVQNEESHS